MNEKIVVLDDDPTGTQTVHNVPVLTTWSLEVLKQEFLNDLPAFYVLTNTRAMLPGDARRLNLELAHNLSEASLQTNKPFVVVSRSDSTLRGHFPLELEALEEALGTVFDAWLLLPFFEAGGRITKNDIHYLREGDTLTPVGETEFARDATFGFRSSNLRAWVEEKTAGRVKADQVQSISLDDIRINQVTKKLLELPKRCICIVNIENRHDMTLFVDGLLKAEGQGRRYLYRTAASFAAARAGIEPRPLLSAHELELPSQGGALVVVGSYVQKTGEQLGQLLQVPGVKGFEVKTEALLNVTQQDQEIVRVVTQLEQDLRKLDKAHVQFRGTKLVFDVVIKEVLLESIDRGSELLS